MCVFFSICQKLASDILDDPVHVHIGSHNLTANEDIHQVRDADAARDGVGGCCWFLLSPPADAVAGVGWLLRFSCVCVCFIFNVLYLLSGVYFVVRFGVTCASFGLSCIVFFKRGSIVICITHGWSRKWLKSSKG